MTKTFLAMGLLFLVSTGVQAAPCNLTIRPDDTNMIARAGYIDGSETARRVSPGGTICIMAGNYKRIILKKFNGAPGLPITVRNEGGQVIIGDNKTADGQPDTATDGGFGLDTSSFIKLTGTGVPSQPGQPVSYGFKILNLKGQAVAVYNLSTDVEIEKIEIAKAGFAGIMAKTDPTCDPTTWKGNFVMKNLIIHDNLIHDVGGEGLYIGNSFGGVGMNKTCDGVVKNLLPHDIVGLKIYSNTIRNTGAEGLQFGCSVNADVHHNSLFNTGISPFALYQNNGLQAGGGSSGNIYANRIELVAGTGITMANIHGDLKVYNNTIINVGGDGVYVNDLPGAVANGKSVLITNNTIINPGTSAFKIYNETNKNMVYNNLVVMNGATKKFIFLKPATAEDKGNIFVSSLSAAGLTDIKSFYVSPRTNSIAVNKGVVDVKKLGILSDARGAPRMLGGVTDAGAMEVK